MLANSIVSRIDVETHLARLVGRGVSVIVALPTNRSGDVVIAKQRRKCVVPDRKDWSRQCRLL